MVGYDSKTGEFCEVISYQKNVPAHQLAYELKGICLMGWWLVWESVRYVRRGITKKADQGIMGRNSPKQYETILRFAA